MDLCFGRIIDFGLLRGTVTRAAHYNCARFAGCVLPPAFDGPVVAEFPHEGLPEHCQFRRCQEQSDGPHTKNLESAVAAVGLPEGWCLRFLGHISIWLFFPASEKKVGVPALFFERTEILGGWAMPGDPAGAGHFRACWGPIPGNRTIEKFANQRRRDFGHPRHDSARACREPVAIYGLKMT